MNAFLIFYVASGLEVGSYKDVSELCDESIAKSNCTIDDDCNSGSCVEAANNGTVMTSIRSAVGPIDLLDEKVCQCQGNYFGPSCSISGVVNEQCPDKNYCKNGGENSWMFNPLSGCVCTNTHFFGWHCEHDNLELCSHVNHVGMAEWVTAEMNTTDCGECILHADCISHFNLTDVICVHKMTNGKPDNHCAVQCTEGQLTTHGVCEHDENAGESVWKCHHGYEGDCKTETECEDRCMNGGEKLCDKIVDPNGACVCENAFEGHYCEKPSPCHPAFCDLSINQCKLENGMKVCAPETEKTSGAKVCFSLMLGFVSFIDILF